jgi:hypothetical protein
MRHTAFVVLRQGMLSGEVPEMPAKSKGGPDA